MLAAIKSPHLIRYRTSFLESSEVGESICIVMEYADGGTLADMIRRYRTSRSCLPEDVLWRCLIQVTFPKLHKSHSLRTLSSAISLYTSGKSAISNVARGVTSSRPYFAVRNPGGHRAQLLLSELSMPVIAGRLLADWSLSTIFESSTGESSGSVCSNEHLLWLAERQSAFTSGCACVHVYVHSVCLGVRAFHVYARARAVVTKT